MSDPRDEAQARARGKASARLFLAELALLDAEMALREADRPALAERILQLSNEVQGMATEFGASLPWRDGIRVVPLSGEGSR